MGSERKSQWESRGINGGTDGGMSVVKQIKRKSRLNSRNDSNYSINGAENSKTHISEP